MDIRALYSELSPIGYQSGSCGYCGESGKRTPNSSNSYYVQTRKLNADHYQSLVDRGWRRSGTLLYKPDLSRSCCPHYTIRLPVTALQTTRDQRQALHRWNRFILGDKYEKDEARLYPKTKQQKAQQRNEFNLPETVHRCEYDNIRRPPEPDHKFSITLEHDDFTEEKYQLYENYQRIVHKESPSSISRTGFKRFLCSSPLVRSASDVSHHQGFGSFHQCYRVDGRLIAMGVLDLLPHAVSGVYFIYHEDYERYNMGKLSALREAALALEGGYEYYYMGFYIHSCVKMRYKGDYKPQYMLDPMTYDWHLLDETLKARLSATKFLSPSNMNPPGEVDGHVYAVGGESEQLEDAQKATMSGLTIFDLKVPGVMTLEEVEEQVDLDAVLVLLGRGRREIAPVGALVGWEESSYQDPHSLKGIVAELVAAVGPVVTRGMLLSFS